jgi:glycosyltransferase involved in cell wall biosynthesis
MYSQLAPKISVITITFNAEEMLKRTAETVLEQTYGNIEYLIVDGGSDDQTLTIINNLEKDFSAKHIPFFWISEPDKGIYDAMNKGMKMASGDYFWFMNAGDIIASQDCLENIFKNIPEENGVKTILPDFIYGETMIVRESGQIMGSRRLKAPDKLDWKSFRMGMLVCHQSMLVKREIASDFNLTYKYSGDFDWSIGCLRKADYIYNSRQIISHFLDGGVSKKKMKASLKERFQIMVKYYGFIPTVLRHIWFVFRAAWFKIFHGWI